MVDQSDDSLTSALARHEIELPARQVSKLDRYCELLWDWNTRLNLTRHTDYEKFVTRDLIDCLQLAQLLDQGERVLDVGSGGGVPGIVLAVIRPDLQMTLCDSAAKKMRVLGEIAADLELPVTIFHGRGENILAEIEFTAVVVRAVGSLCKILNWLESHWAAVGRLYAVKGPKWTEERKEARHRGLLQDLALRKAASYPIPGRDFESVILKIRPNDDHPQP